MKLKKDELKLSVIMPCYNEMGTLEDVIDSVRNCGIKNLEIIIVDDCSTDGTRELLQTELGKKVERVLYHKKNMGKGAALRNGFQAATGDLVVVQDADSEYDPKDYLTLIEPFTTGRGDAEVVYGSRYARSEKYMIKRFYHSAGNKFLTFMSNVFSDLALTDMETCYKMFRREIIQSIPIKEDRFGFEPEITAKIAKKKCKIYEVPISYYPRSYDEGKKIGVKDGFRAIYCILKYNLFDHSYRG